MTVALVFIAAGAFSAGAMLAGLLIHRGERNARRARCTRVAAPLVGGQGAEDQKIDAATASAGAFREASERPWLWHRIETRWPMLRGEKALPKALLAALGCVVAAWGAWTLLRLPAGGGAVAGLAAGVAGGWFTLSWLHLRVARQFTDGFPDAVDQIVRLANAGVPTLEAISIIGQDAPEPIGPIMRELRDVLQSGLDPEQALTATSSRYRLKELALFCAVLRLQRRSGGRISTVFANLSETLREQRRTALRVKAATAETRLTVLILAAMPVAMLALQSFAQPESMQLLFGTEQGLMLLRWGGGLIVAGLLVVKGIGSRLGV